MTEVSVHTSDLETLAGQFEDIGEDKTLTTLVDEANIDGAAWPWAGSEDMPDDYSNLVGKMSDAVEMLRDVTTSVGKALRKVSDHYREIEEAGEDDAGSIDTD